MKRRCTILIVAAGLCLLAVLPAMLTGGCGPAPKVAGGQVRTSGEDTNPLSPPPGTPSSRNTFEIVSIESRVTESNSSWWRYAWRLELKNTGDSPIVLDAEIEFQDGDGFIVDSDRSYDLALGPGEQKTFTGFALITAGVAKNVRRTNAKVGRS